MRSGFRCAACVLAHVVCSVAQGGASETLIGVIKQPDEGAAGRIIAYKYNFTTGDRSVMYSTPRLSQLRACELLVDRLGRRFLIDGLHQSGPQSFSVKSLNEDICGTFILSEYNNTDLSRLSLSPNAKMLVGYNPLKREIVLISDSVVKAYPASGSVCSPFSWSPDSSRAAFYYSTPPAEEDVQGHGVAIVSLDGGLQVLCEPQEETATPYSGAKEVRIGWSAAGTSVYISEGRLPADAPTDIYYRRRFRRRVVTVRIEVASKQKVEIADGEFSDVAPDESYVLVQRTSGRIGGDMFTRCFVRDLRSDAEHHLAEGLRYPKISPSGRLAACLKTAESIVCLRTSDWQPVGSPVSNAAARIPTNKWATEFRWITAAESNSKPAE